MIIYVLQNVIEQMYTCLKNKTNHSCGTNSDYGKFDHKKTV